MKNKNASKLSRRTFIGRAAASGTALVTLGPMTKLMAENLQQAQFWPANASDFKFHLIGHGHIDPVWLWPWTEGLSVIHSTFRSILDMMNDKPDFCFTSSSAQFYQWVSENDPDMLAEIRKRVDEGRWNIVGGWWVEPDVNMPSGEALARQGLYGQLTLQRLLGRRAKVAFNPDSFGHPGTLPQILKLQGMNNYVFQRPGDYEKDLPSHLFWWESIDGTRVMAYRILYSYNANEAELRDSIRVRVKNSLKHSKGQPMKSFLTLYGVGDHGGGPTRASIRAIEKLKVEKGAPQVVYSTADQYFQEVREEKNLDIPVVKDDLQHHAVGCYTAESGIKKGNRQSEAALVTAEKINAMGSVAWGVNYPKNELTSAWKKVLFLQFHDSLPGTALFEHTQTARQGYGYALEIAENSTYMAVQKLEWQVPTEDPESEYLLVFNPHAWEVSGIIEHDYNWEFDTSRVEDENGNSLPHQWASASSNTHSRKKLVVNATIPPLGYRQLRLLKTDSFPGSSISSAVGNKLENEFLRVKISKSGTIGIFDKQNRKQIFTGEENGCRAVVIDDPSDTWGHGVKSFSDEIGAFGNAEIKVVENGPLRATIRVITSYNRSTLTIDWTLYAASKKLEAKVMLDFQERLKMIKFSFPVDIEDPVATYEIPYGHIVRAVNGDEDPGQRWIDLSGRRNGSNCGLTVINDAKYGYSVTGNDMRVSVARSAVYAHHAPNILDEEGVYYWMDQGIQTFRMLLVPHQDTLQKSNIARIADEFIALPVSVYQGIHGGSMPKSGSFLAVDQQNIIVSAIKQSEDGEDLIIRCIETSGSATQAVLDLRFAKSEWEGSFRPFEIKTLRIEKQTRKVYEVNILEE